MAVFLADPSAEKCQEESCSRSPFKEKGIYVRHLVEPLRTATRALTLMNIHETATAGLNSKISSSSFFAELSTNLTMNRWVSGLLLLLSQLERILTLSIKQRHVKGSADVCTPKIKITLFSHQVQVRTKYSGKKS